MTKETKSLRKMYLLSDTTVQKLKDLDDAEKEFTILDKRMKQILYNKKLPPTTKWMLYNNLLVKYNNLRRQMSNEYHTEYDRRRKYDSTAQTDYATAPRRLSDAVIEPFGRPTGTYNPFDANIKTNLPDFDKLDFSNDFEKQKHSEFFHNLAGDIHGVGDNEPATPSSSHRLSVASQASTRKKSVNPLRHHLMVEPSFIHDTTPDFDRTMLSDTPIEEEEEEQAEEEEKEPSPAPKKKRGREKKSVTIDLNDFSYSVHKDDEDDFREFAAEELTKYPMQTKLENWRFQQFKKRKNKEFKDLMEAEKSMVEEEKKREKRRRSEAQQDQQNEEIQTTEKAQRRKIEQREHWANANLSGIKRDSTSPVKKKVLRKQPSVAIKFPKTKSNVKQGGKGKIVRWYNMK